MTAGQRPGRSRAHLARLSVAVALLLVLWCGYLGLRMAPAGYDRDEGAAAPSAPDSQTASPAATYPQQTPGATAALTVASPRPEAPRPEPPSAAEKGLDELGLTDEDLAAAMDNYTRRQVREAQDQAMSQWPSYAQVRDQYVTELSSTLDLEHLSCAQMLDLAVAFRQSFWVQGGDLAAHSYRLAYLARALLEQAHQRFPDDLNILDELIETIQSTDLILKFDPVQQRDRPNETVRQELQDLRQQQWALVQSQQQAGRAPCMQDFVCACDLAYLLQPKNAPASKQIVRWLRDADDGTWHQYQRLLQHWEGSLDRGLHFAFTIYQIPPRSGPERYRYGRRLPSFRGPTDRQVSFWTADGTVVFEAGETAPRR